MAEIDGAGVYQFDPEQRHDIQEAVVQRRMRTQLVLEGGDGSVQ
jgi:hypothetical protein